MFSVDEYHISLTSVSHAGTSFYNFMLSVSRHHALQVLKFGDGGGLQIVKVAANILNKQSWTAKRVVLRLGDGQGN
jgi:hypothetical protein